MVAGAICAVHPHNQELCDHIEKKYFWAKNQTGPQAYAKSLRYGNSVIYDTTFPALIVLARSVGVKLHILHINTVLGVDMIGWAANNKINITAEINPAHLFLTWKDIEKKGPYVLGKWTPPKDQEALWTAVTGEKPGPFLIGTDHAPHTIEEKEIGWKDMWKSPGGAPYIQDYLSRLLSADKSRRPWLAFLSKDGQLSQASLSLGSPL